MTRRLVALAVGVTMTTTGVLFAEPASAIQIAPGTAATTWANCGILAKDTKIVRSFTRIRADTGVGYTPGGISNLACGNAAWGYRHILQRHAREWEYDAFRTQGNWRDVADFAIAAALRDPDATAYDQGRDTFCYSRLILLINNRTGQQVGTRTPNVIIAGATKNIITAFPTNVQCGGRR
jgi:hypothetical protein